MHLRQGQKLAGQESASLKCHPEPQQEKYFIFMDDQRKDPHHLWRSES